MPNIAYEISIQAQSLRLMDFNYSAIQAGRIVRSILSKHVLMLILLELFSIFGRTKFIINSNKAHYKISMMVAFCPVVFCPYTKNSVHRQCATICMQCEQL